MGNQLHGSLGRAYMATANDGSAPVAVAKVTRWTLDMGTDVSDTTGMGDSNKTGVQGLPNRNGTIEMWLDDAETKPFAAARSATGTFLYLYSRLSPPLYHYGPAWFSLSQEASVGAAQRLTGTFTANGPWGSNF